MKYFYECSTIEELKKLYRKLAIKNHPDRGGSEEVMKEINDEYKIMLEKLAFVYNAEHEETDETFDWKNDFYADIIQKIIKFENLEIELIGTWIWCFNAYEYHEQLKELGFWYSKTKKAWVYSGSKKKAFYRSKNSVDDLRQMWGSEKIKTEKKEKIA